MTRWRPRGVVFKVRRVLGGLWVIFCKLFCIYDLGCVFAEYYRILQGFGYFSLFRASGVSISSIRMSGLMI